MASINYAVTDNWGSGFVGNMTVASGNQALHGWTVEFDAAFGVKDLFDRFGLAVFAFLDVGFGFLGRLAGVFGLDRRLAALLALALGFARVFILFFGR